MFSVAAVLRCCLVFCSAAVSCFAPVLCRAVLRCVVLCCAVVRQVMDMPFDSSKKWCLSIHKKVHADGDLVLFMKGAPERCAYNLPVHIILYEVVLL